jgi:DNA-binding response OmpR family regulator
MQFFCFVCILNGKVIPDNISDNIPNIPAMSDKASLDIVIIDDETEICVLISSFLLKEGFRVKFAGTLSKGKKLLQQESPATLILDNHLPDGKGVDMVAYARSLHPGIRIIMMSAYDDAHDKQLAYHKGIDYFLSKPIDIHHLLSMLPR